LVYRLLSLLFLASAAHVVSAQDPPKIIIDKGVESALPIAIVPFASTASGAPVDVSEVIAADLRNSGYFNPMPAADMPSQPATFDQVNFADWRRLGMDNLVIGRVTALDADQYQVEFRLFDVISARQLTGLRFTTSARSLRFRSHQIADLIFEQITGTPGAFATRVAYVAVSRRGPDTKRYFLQIADADGYDARTIYESSEPILSPAWSPDGRQIAFVSFIERRSSVYVQDIFSGKRRKLDVGRGLNSAPAWSPDGSRLAVTLSRDGNPDIYIHELDGGLRRLTQHRAIDTEPAWAPDGRSLVFTSDRGGNPQIYRVRVDGANGPERVTFEGEYNARASFSPDGRALAMVHSNGQGYRIAHLDLEYGALTVLTTSRLDESPSFSPNGNMLVYATSGRGGSELKAVSVDGRVHLSLAAQFDEVREPAWGPFRK
jgi:TolB protein